MKNSITVVIPVSPIKSHPETNILEETISTIRYHLPNSEIIITFDGVRPEQENMRPAYEEHIRRILWKFRKLGTISPYIFEDHKHQVGMMREIIDSIKTPLILYVEQDTPLVTDEPIEWQLIQDELLSGNLNLVRLHHEGVVPLEHSHLMLGFNDSGFLRTVQWSQRPHISTKAFYRRILSENFSDKANCFIEDLLHGKVMNSFNADGVLGWDQWKLGIYHPMTGNIKRSYHTDGRQGGKKYDSGQIW